VTAYALAPRKNAVSLAALFHVTQPPPVSLGLQFAVVPLSHVPIPPEAGSHPLGAQYRSAAWTEAALKSAAHSTATNAEWSGFIF
jgi:hypothetical protein